MTNIPTIEVDNDDPDAKVTVWGYTDDPHDDNARGGDDLVLSGYAESVKVDSEDHERVYVNIGDYELDLLPATVRAIVAAVAAAKDNQ